MAILNDWDTLSNRLYETGVKKGVLFVKDGSTYGTGVAWVGLTAVTEAPSGAEATPLYADDEKYVTLMSKEEFGGTIEAYTYPEPFAECDGSAGLGDIAGVTIGQQTRKEFGLCYQTTVGDGDGQEHKKLHIVYGCKASPSERAYATINDSPEAMTFSWEFTTTPVPVTGHGATSIVTIDEKKVGATNWDKIIGKLYGTAEGQPTLPTPDEIKTLLGTT